MNENEIRKAIHKGRKVNWNNDNYILMIDESDNLLIKCLSTGHCLQVNSHTTVFGNSFYEGGK
jgi:hypothetical protein